MAYSTQSDLLYVIPDASSYVPSELDADAYFSQQRSWAASFIDNKIKNITATPSSEDLAEIEAYLVAYRLLRQNFASRDMDGSRQFYQTYMDDAASMLSYYVFPATYSTPEQMADFDGSGTISLTVYDQWTYTSDWVVKCISGGSTTAEFEIWNETRGVLGYYNIGNDDHFPTEEQIDTYSSQSRTKEIKIVITGNVGAPFTIGDAWQFRTYARRRLKTPRGMGTIPILRS